MDFKIMKCPVCGSPLDAGPDEKFIICRACDTPLRLNEDATSFLRDPEAFGYGFEKGRQRARAEEEQRRSIERGSFYDQSVPNQPRNTSAMPLSVFRMVEKRLLIPSQIEEKISFTPVHA